MSTGNNLNAYLKGRETFSESLNKVMRFHKYNGNRIEERADGFYWLGRKYGNKLEEVENYLDSLTDTIANSIIRAQNLLK